ncbi:DUF6884 domain-containing protein [Pontibacter harenae]|uniref:DUF6884 domain-containing protein n=1 Tax=Pontibacter harenae TaxID=2894083 RepID=UPI0034E24897
MYLVSCVSVKKNKKAAATDLYISSWFKKAKAFTQERADEWFILSAKYGLVAPSDMIEPYEKTLNSMPKKERLKWADEVLKSIEAKTTVGDHIVFLAGVRYREFLVRNLVLLGYTVEVPLANMGIGEQLSWLGKNIK